MKLFVSLIYANVMMSNPMNLFRNLGINLQNKSYNVPDTTDSIGLVLTAETLMSFFP